MNYSKIISWIKSLIIRNSVIEQNETQFGFESLTPTDNADNGRLYCNALNEALANPNHYNIALTGGYGTGKSSIVETYLSQEKRFAKEKFLRISLANFNFRSPESIKKRRPIISGRRTDEDEEQILLEIGVLQQIIFQIHKKAVIQKFRKKIRPGIWSPLLLVSLFIFALLSGLLFWYPEVFLDRLFVEVPNKPFEYRGKTWFILMFVFSIVITAFLLTIVLQSIIKLRVNKVEVKSVGVNFNKDSTKFSLDSHIDELIYLLKKGKISLVIFEDIDRVGDFEIFEKLREINHILKYSPDLKSQKVRFLYVLRESVFKSENEKNKFFDLVIPVVPFISTKNSQAKMLDLFENEISSIDNSIHRGQFAGLIKTSSLCIDEMRTIKSIYNDYLVYLNIIGKNGENKVPLLKHELLGVIIYKNLFSLDFEKINSGTSKLELILQNRTKFLTELQASKSTQLKSLEEKFESDQENEFLEKKIKSLKSEIQRLPNLTFANLVRQSNNQRKLSNLIHDVYPEKNPNYDATEHLLESQDLRSELKINLLTTLFLEGHINLDYKHYTSVFHEGDLSFTDRASYMKFRTGEIFDFEQHFDSPSSFLAQFTPADWNHQTYFCEELFDEMLFNSNYSEQLDIIFSSGSDYHLKFLNFYIPKSMFLRKLSDHLFKNWEGFTESVLKSEFIEQKSFDLLIPHLILNQDLTIISNQNRNGVLSEYLSSKENITSLFPKDQSSLKDSKNELVYTLKYLEVSFYQLVESSKSWLLSLTLKNNLYELNIQMLRLWGQLFGDEKLLNPTYINVMNCSLQDVNRYVSSNLFEFTNNVLFELKNETGSWKEDETSLIKLLASKEEINKEKIIEDVDFFEFDLEHYAEEHWRTIVGFSKLRCNWMNIILYSEQFGIDDALISLINDVNWINEIDKFTDNETEEFNYQRALGFWETLLGIKTSEKSLIKIKSTFGYYIPQSIISSVTDQTNLEILIRSRAFYPQKATEVYEQIKTHFRKELIHMKFAYSYMTALSNTEGTDTILQGFEKDELVFIAQNNFSRQFFEKAFKQIRNIESLRLTKKEATDIIRLIKKYHFLENKLLLKTLINFITMNEQIKFFNWLKDEKVIDKWNSNEYLVQFKGELINLNKPRLKFKLNKNDINLRFVENLLELGLINSFNKTESKTISFYRNHYRSFNN